jgi:hypothetical protein
MIPLVPGRPPRTTLRSAHQLPGCGFVARCHAPPHVLGVKGISPPEQDGGLPCDVLKDAVPEQPDPQPAHVLELTLGILPRHLAATHCLVQKREHLRPQKVGASI